MSTVFLALAILSASLGVASFVLMAAALERRGIRVNMPLVRFYFFRYLSQYRSITISETGKVGPLYNAYVAAMLVALVCAIIGLLLRAR